MPYYKKLVGEICYLSPCTPEDAENWAAWFNDLEVTIPLGDEAYTPSTLEREGEMIDEINRNLDHVFTIVDLETDQAIGRCLLFAIDQINRNGMLGI
ncbi:MAG: N-acetyltransferase, partial [Gemmatimonadetes bacterium]|nr:N-acetyltransferase [Gemmatimonadota bacterium]